MTEHACKRGSDGSPCNNIRKGESYTPDQCRLCWLFQHDARYNSLWGGDGQITKVENYAPVVSLASVTTTVKSQQTESRPCVHLGETTGDVVQCKTCNGNVRLKVHDCSIHSRCVQGNTVEGVQGCKNCPDRTYANHCPDAGQVRHLLFHLYPLQEDGYWRWHVEQLARYINLFNGRKILAIATDDRCDLTEIVRGVCSPLFDEIIEMDNDPKLREVKTFLPLFSHMRSMKPQEAFLYAHSKGVLRSKHSTARRWTELLYDIYMNHWEHTQTVLQKHPIAGAFKKIGRGFNWAESSSEWHYSGSWCWYRSRELFGQLDWTKIDRFWSGIETYPSLHFTEKEAGCLFYEDRAFNLYDEDLWYKKIEPLYEQWLEDRIEATNTEPVLDGLKLELGGGDKPRGNGWINVDRYAGKKVDVVANFEMLGKDDSIYSLLPYDSDSVSEVYSSHCFEHIRNLHGLLHEIVRVCKIGAKIEIRVPHYLSPMAMCHGHVHVIPPEQVQHWCEDAIDYWWRDCSKRFKLVRMEQVKGGRFTEAKTLHRDWSDEQIMRYVPGAAHEMVYHLRVFHNERD